SASAKASSRMDFPAPVSPVRAASPEEKSMSSLSIRTISRTDRRTSMKHRRSLRHDGYELLEAFHCLAQPRALVFARLEAVGLQQIIGVLVPGTVREVVPEHGRRRLGLAGDAEGEIGLRQPLQGFLDLPRRLVMGDDRAETVDSGGILTLVQIIAADEH